MAKKECSKCDMVYGVHYCNDCHLRIQPETCKIYNGICGDCRAAARGEFGTPRNKMMRAPITKESN